MGGLGSSGSDRPGAAVRSRALRPGPPEAAERTSTAQQARRYGEAVAVRGTGSSARYQLVSGADRRHQSANNRRLIKREAAENRDLRTPAGEEVAFLAVVLETRPSGRDLYSQPLWFLAT